MHTSILHQQGSNRTSSFVSTENLGLIPISAQPNNIHTIGDLNCLNFDFVTKSYKINLHCAVCEISLQTLDKCQEKIWWSMNFQLSMARNVYELNADINVKLTFKYTIHIFFPTMESPPPCIFIESGQKLKPKTEKKYRNFFGKTWALKIEGGP